DPNAPDEIAAPVNPKLAAAQGNGKDDEEEEDEDAGAGEEEDAPESGPDPEEALARFTSLSKLHQQVLKGGDDRAKLLKLRKKLGEEFMELKLSPKMFDSLIGQLRDDVAEIRQLEKQIMVLCVRDAGMPRKDFIGTFPK